MRIAPFITCLVAIALVGCSKRQSDERLVETAVKAEKNSAKIDELSLGLEGINARLANIESSLEALREGSSDLGKAKSASASAPAAGSVEFQNVSREVAVLTQGLASVKDEVASTNEALEKTKRMLSKPKDPFKAIHALIGKPEEFVNGLDRFLENASAKIEDPAARQNFQAEVAQLRDRVLSGYSPDELYQELRDQHLEKLNFVTDERDRHAIERGIAELDNCSEEELRKRLDKYGRERTLHEFFGIVKVYGLGKEDIHDSFLTLRRKK